MLFLTTYENRPGNTAEENQRLMTIFAERGAEPGTIAHYVRIDGSGGIVIAENDDATQMYEGFLAYGEFLDFEVTPILAVDDAVGPILTALANQTGS